MFDVVEIKEITEHYTKEEWSAKVDDLVTNGVSSDGANVDLTGYAKKSDIPDVSKFITSIPSEYVTESELNAKGYLTQHIDISGKADKNHTHSQYLTEHQSLDGYATETYVTNKISEAQLQGGNGESVDLSGYALKSEIPDVSGFIKTIPSEYVTETELNNAIANIEIPESSGGGNGVGQAGAGTNAEIFNDYTNNVASEEYAHAEGYMTSATAMRSHAEGQSTKAEGVASHAEGTSCTASGHSSHAEGDNCRASGQQAHAEGWKCIASGGYSHAEGTECQATNSGAHAEGSGCRAEGRYSHAEGFLSQATANYSHAEGYTTKVTGQKSHAEGSNTIASGAVSHAEGGYTEAASQYQHAQGSYNIVDSNGKYAHIVGNGTSSTARSNAHTLDWQGNAWFAGNVYIGGTSMDDATMLTVGGSGGGSSETWETIYEEEYTVRVRNDLATKLESCVFNLNDYSKVRIIAVYTTSGLFKPALSVYNAETNGGIKCLSSSGSASNMYANTGNTLFVGKVEEDSTGLYTIEAHYTTQSATSQTDRFYSVKAVTLADACDTLKLYNADSPSDTSTANITMNIKVLGVRK